MDVIKSQRIPLYVDISHDGFKMFLETDRIMLREITKDDDVELYLLDSDPEIMKFVANGRPSSKKEVDASIERILTLRDQHNGKFGCWAALEKSTDHFIGWFLFRPAQNDAQNTKRIELGYRLKKEYWGLGLATEVSKAIIAKGFSEYPLDEIFAVAMKGNLGSLAVMRKAGMHFVREFTSGEFSSSVEDLVEYSISRNLFFTR